MEHNVVYEEYKPPQSAKPVEEPCEPRLYSFLMKDKASDVSKIGPYATRSKRNKWAEDVAEALIREKTPKHFYSSYDVSSLQGTNFHEFTYTEFAGGGVFLSTQSKEINCRLIDFASKVDYGEEADKALAKFIEIQRDKYDLKKIPEKYKDIKKIIFMPGHNLFDLADVEIVDRLIFEEDDIMIKPHPLTSVEFVRKLASKVGWERIIDKDVSGTHLLANCDEVYTTTASEFSITGAALGKRVYNISVFSSEGAGVYLPFSRVTTITQKVEGIEAAKKKLGNILACPWSGLIFEHQADFEDRIDQYFKKALELRDLYKPLAMGRGKLTPDPIPLDKKSKTKPQ